jgi:hypothetical protein
MVAFLPTVYEGKPPSVGEQPVNTRARGYSSTNYFESAADDRYMPAQRPLIIQGKVQVKADAEASIAAVVQGKEPIHFRAPK